MTDLKKKERAVQVKRTKHRVKGNARYTLSEPVTVAIERLAQVMEFKNGVPVIEQLATRLPDENGDIYIYNYSIGLEVILPRPVAQLTDEDLEKIEQAKNDLLESENSEKTSGKQESEAGSEDNESNGKAKSEDAVGAEADEESVAGAESDGGSEEAENESDQDLNELDVDAFN